MAALTQKQKNQKLWEAAGDGLLAEVDAALAMGANIDVSKALIQAAYHGHADICLKLLEKGADANVIDSGDSNPRHGNALIWAACMGHTYICRILIEHGAYVEHKDEHDNAAFHYTGQCNQSETGKLLLRVGARHNSSDLAQSWLAEMAIEAREAFPVGSTPSEGMYFYETKPNDMVLDACATGLFGALIAAPLMISDKREDRELFQRIWDGLPPRWQHEYATLQVVLAKERRVELSTGHHSSWRESVSNASTQREVS